MKAYSAGNYYISTADIANTLWAQGSLATFATTSNALTPFFQARYGYGTATGGYAISALGNGYVGI